MQTSAITIKQTLQAEPFIFKQKRKVPLKKLDLSKWLPSYEKCTGLRSRDWEEIDANIKSNISKWEKLKRGESIRLPKEDSKLARTLVVFRDARNSLFVIVLLKSKGIKVLGEGTQKSPVKLALNALTGELFAERTRYESPNAVELDVVGKPGIMDPEIFRASFKATKVMSDENMREIEKIFVLFKRYDGTLLNLIFNDKISEIKNALEEFSVLFLKLKNKVMRSKAFAPDFWGKDMDDYFYQMEFASLIHPLAFQKALKRMEGFIDGLETIAANGGKKFNIQSQLKISFNKAYEHLSELSLKTVNMVSPHEKFIVGRDMIRALISLIKSNVFHGDISEDNILYELDTEGNLIGAKLIDFNEAVSLDEASQEPADSDIESMGEVLSKLYFEKFGEQPSKVTIDKLSKSDPLEGIILGMIDGTISNQSHLETALTIIEKKLDSDEKKDDI